MSEQKFLDRLRLLLRDPEKAVWTDEAMLAAIGEGKREYCRRVPALTGILPVFPERDGRFLWPDEFGRYLYGVNRDGERIEAATRRRAAPLENETGEPVCLLDSGEAHFSLVPKPDLSEFVFAAFNPEYGKILNDDSGPDYYALTYDEDDAAYLMRSVEIALDSEYGIVRTWENSCSNSEYGLIREIVSGEPVATLRYWRLADDEEWELDNMLGSVYCAAYLLLTAETDRKDANAADMMQELFNRECNEFAHRRVRALRTIRNGGMM